MSWSEIIQECREKWDELGTEERYYVAVIALSAFSVLAGLVPRGTPEHVHRVKIEQ